jgi:hypothetical protein
MLGFSSAVSSSGSSKTSSTGKSVKPEILADDFTVLSDKGDKVEKKHLGKSQTIQDQNISKYVPTLDILL